MSLDEQARQRKERLALLQATKRKHSEVAPSSSATGNGNTRPDEDNVDDLQEPKLKVARNYDMETKLPKLGFLQAETLTGGEDTVEHRARQLIEEAAQDTAAAEEAEGEGAETDALDLAQLQPKKPDWDLKRDLAARMEPFRRKQQQVVDGLVRDRIRAARGSGAAKQVDGDAMVRESKRLEAQAHGG